MKPIFLLAKLSINRLEDGRQKTEEVHNFRIQV